MTIEQKAKAYDEKLDVARHIYADPSVKDEDKYYIEVLFPELTESEDERIRKALISFLKSPFVNENITDEKVTPWIAWLEKQGEQKFSDIDNKFLRMRETKPANIVEFLDRLTTVEQEFLWEHIEKVKKIDREEREQKPADEIGNYDHEKVFDSLMPTEMKTPEESLGVDSDTYNKIVDECIYGEQKPTDKVEPKFKVGDFIVNDYCMGRIVEITNDAYLLDTEQGIPFSCHSTRLWDITKDANDGDVLIDKSNNRECPFVFKKTKPSDIKTDCLNPLTVLGYCGIGGAGFTKSEGWGDTANCIYYPATKEQRDTLLKTMTDAGYTFNFEKKELKKIEQKPTDNKGMNIDEESMTPFQKEVFCIIDTTIEEEQGLKQVCDKLLALASNEIKQKPAWSEEDEEMLNQVIEDIVKLAGPYVCYHKDVDWLKSLKERVQTKQEWKQENIGDLTDFEIVMMHIGDSFFGENAGLDPNDTNAIKEQANILLGLVAKQKWNEEDMYNLDNIIWLCDNCMKNIETTWIPSQASKIKSLIERIKENIILQPQSQWKPSDKQMKAIGHICDGN